MAASQSPKLFVGVRVPGGTPNASMVKLVDTRDLKSLAARCPGSTPGTRTNYRRSRMSKQEDTLNKAYGNMPKDVGFSIVWDIVPSWRGIKYYWHKLIRKVTR